jgi:hypothetical protein
MKSLLPILLLLTGCTSLHVVQTDETPGSRIIVTDIRASAWFSSAQALSKLKATTTDKTQAFGVDSIAQQGATNTVEALRNIVRIMELMRPTP